MPSLLGFSVGYNFDRTLLEAMIGANTISPIGRVRDLYGSMPDREIGSARPSFRLTSIDDVEFRQQVRLAKEAGICFNYTLNTSLVDTRLLDSHIRSIQKFLDFLKSAGVDIITVAHPLIAEIVMDNSDIPMMASTIMQINSERKLETLLLRFPSMKRVCLDLYANRDFKFLDSIKNYPVELELLVNEFCVLECIDRNYCYDLHSLNMKKEDTKLFNWYPMGKCVSKRSREPEEWLMANFILPQWCNTYATLYNISRFKISGRTHPTNFILWVTHQYINGYPFLGNLLDLWGHLENIGRKEDETIAPRQNIPLELLPTDFLIKLMSMDRYREIRDYCREIVKQMEV